MNDSHETSVNMRIAHHSLDVIHFVMAIISYKKSGLFQSTTTQLFFIQRLSFDMSVLNDECLARFLSHTFVKTKKHLPFSFIGFIWTTVFTLTFSHFPSLVTDKNLTCLYFQEACRLCRLLGKEMSLKLFILFMTYVLLAYGDDVERKGNKSTCHISSIAIVFRYSALCAFEKIKQMLSSEKRLLRNKMYLNFNVN